MKKLFKHYTSYGKGDNEKLLDMDVIEDTAESRKEYLEANCSYCDIDSEEDFINMKTNACYYYATGGDWDDATGGSIHVVTYEEELGCIVDTYIKDVWKLEQLFGVKTDEK